MRNEKAIELLEKLEYSGDNHPTKRTPRCPICWATIHEPHKKECLLYQALALLQKQPPEGDFTKELRKICEEEQKEIQPFIELQIVIDACVIIDQQADFINKLVPDGDLGYWAEEYLHAYKQLSNMQELQDKFDRQVENNKNQAAKIERLKEALRRAMQCVNNSTYVDGWTVEKKRVYIEQP